MSWDQAGAPYFTPCCFPVRSQENPRAGPMTGREGGSCFLRTVPGDPPGSRIPAGCRAVLVENLFYLWEMVESEAENAVHLFPACSPASCCACPER